MLNSRLQDLVVDIEDSRSSKLFNKNDQVHEQTRKNEAILMNKLTRWNISFQLFRFIKEFGNEEIECETSFEIVSRNPLM